MGDEMGGACSPMGEMRNAYKTWTENLKGRDHVEDLGVGGRIILEVILGNFSGKMWNGFICLKIGTSGGLL
jgi:hypothetical protein